MIRLGVPKQRLRPIGGHGGFGSKALVPGTDFVADVATEDPAIEFLRQIVGYGTALLDGEVGDAAGGIQHPGLDERIGGAGVEAPGTAAAVIGDHRRIGSQFRISENLPDEEPRPDSRPEQHGILANPAQPGTPGQFTFRNWSRVHIAAGVAGTVLTHPGREGLDPLEHGDVIVPASRVARNLGPSAFGPGIGPEVVVQQQHDALRPAVEQRRVISLLRLTMDIAHGSATPCSQPRIQLGGIRIGRKVGHSAGQEVQLGGPALDVCRAETHATVFRWLVRSKASSDARAPSSSEALAMRRAPRP